MTNERVGILAASSLKYNRNNKQDFSMIYKTRDLVRRSGMVVWVNLYFNKVLIRSIRDFIRFKDILNLYFNSKWTS